MAWLILGVVIGYFLYKILREDDEEKERIIKEEESSFEDFRGRL